MVSIELWGIAEFAIHYNISKQRICNWNARRDLPVHQKLRQGPIFIASEVRAWMIKNHPEIKGVANA